MRRDATGPAAPWRKARTSWLLSGAVIGLAVITVLELRAEVPSWLLPARHLVVGGLHWVNQHWLNAVAITAAATIAAAAVPFVIRRLDQADGGPSEAKQARQRRVMLLRVRHKWVTSVLEPSLAGTAHLALGLRPRSDVLALGDRSAADIFRGVGGALLILGAPGAGKTTLLLQLADKLLRLAENDDGQPIPVVMNLSSWAVRRQPIATWLAEELTSDDDYRVPPDTAADWVGQDSLMLLLDGFDEVADQHRAACAAAINEYRRRHGLVPIAICSRTRELDELDVRLDIKEAIELQPPTESQISTYLDHLESTGIPLADVRAALATDAELRDLLRSPLTLHVIALAYPGQQPTALSQPGTADERRKRLWQAYISQMFRQHPLPADCGYTATQAIRSLTWLAGCLRLDGQYEFRLDRLTAKWLPVRKSRQSGSFGRSIWIQQKLVRAEDLVIPNTEKLGGGMVIFNPAVLKRRVTSNAVWTGAPVAAIGAGLAAGLARGPVVGLATSLATGFVSGVVQSQLMRRFPPYEGNFLVSWAGANKGTWRAAKHGIKAGLAALLLFSLLFGLPWALAFGRLSGLIAGLAFGAWFGLVVGACFGGKTFMVHFTVRALLARSKVVPWRVLPFLDAMTGRLLLRRSGTSYEFVYPSFRDHLAEESLILSSPDSLPVRQGDADPLPVRRPSDIIARYLHL